MSECNGYRSVTTVNSTVLDCCGRIERIIYEVDDQYTIDCLRLVIEALEALAIQEVRTP